MDSRGRRQERIFAGTKVGGQLQQQEGEQCGIPVRDPVLACELCRIRPDRQLP